MTTVYATHEGNQAPQLDEQRIPFNRLGLNVGETRQPSSNGSGNFVVHYPSPLFSLRSMRSLAAKKFPSASASLGEHSPASHSAPAHTISFLTPFQSLL